VKSLNDVKSSRFDVVREQEKEQTMKKLLQQNLTDAKMSHMIG